MEKSEKIIQLLEKMVDLLESGQSDYCESDEACRIMGIRNYRHLPQLHKKGVLPRYRRGNGFKYKKKDCLVVAAALDNQTLVLEPLSQEKDHD